MAEHLKKSLELWELFSQADTPDELDVCRKAIYAYYRDIEERMEYQGSEIVDLLIRASFRFCLRALEIERRDEKNNNKIADYIFDNKLGSRDVGCFHPVSAMTSFLADCHPEANEDPRVWQTIKVVARRVAHEMVTQYDHYRNIIS